MRPTSNVLVYGGGAVGSIFGWRVAEAGHRVSVVCRSNYETVHKGGYSLKTTAWGNGRFLPSEVLKSGHVTRFNAIPAYDYVVCANKINEDYVSTLQDLQAVVGPETTLVTAQNGMNVEIPLKHAFPRNTILSAVCNIGCSQILAGVIEQKGSIKRPAFLIGNHDPTTELDVERRDALAAMDAEFSTVECVEQERWRKLVFNSAWNSTTALSGLDTHQLLQRPGAAELVQQIAEEAYKVATASGVGLDDDLPRQTVELARSSAPIVPSTLQDARNQRPMELGPIFGFVTSQAAQVGVHVPHLRRVHSLLLQKNSAYLAQKALHDSTWGSDASLLDRSSRRNDLRVTAGAL